jgi:hypothetical protein
MDIPLHLGLMIVQVLSAPAIQKTDGKQQKKHSNERTETVDLYHFTHLESQ